MREELSFYNQEVMRVQLLLNEHKNIIDNSRHTKYSYNRFFKK